MDQILTVVKQHFGDFERVSYIALSTKIVGTDNGSAAFPFLSSTRSDFLLIEGLGAVNISNRYRHKLKFDIHIFCSSILIV